MCIRDSWKTPRALRSLDVEVEGPDTVCAFISSAQTDGAARTKIPVSSSPPGSLGLGPEDAFCMLADSLGHPAIVWRVGVSMIFEVDSVKSRIRRALGGGTAP